ncbi:cobalamin-binding protein [Pseudomonas sp. MDMC216]|nr:MULTISPECIES: cobalamin-binding protein [unclassified Pseudomonas]MBA4682732.1 cobalamin-binding protein [Pseudomonas sp.]MDI5993714.1 cobalamin-binding protein [Pseudomonas sp. MDMC216]MDI6007962.1 cobalamin-binding protein [Pseudomonas sp. MDMC17]RAR30717.1 cobalamin-binding protein [Pseudomonas sp. MDMC224]
MRTLLLALCLLSLPLTAAERVISLAPSLSEIMLDLDAADLLVGVLDGDERPAALAHLPTVGRYGQLEFERLLQLAPDLILIAPGSVPPAQQAQLQRFGIDLLIVEPQRLEQLGEAFVRIGERVGRAEQGERLADEFRVELDALRQRYRREQPLAVFYQVWHQPLYTIGGEQLIGDALQVCGARNLFADLPQPAPQVSVEAVLARDPDVILGGSNAELSAWQAWPQLHAVRLGQVWAVPDKGLERPSRQMLGAIERLCELVAEAR